MSDFFEVTPEAFWAGVTALCFLVLLAFLPIGRPLLRRFRWASAPRLLVCFAISLSLALVGWFLIFANMEVSNPGVASQVLMSSLLPGIWLASLLGPHAIRVYGFPFVILVSTTLWTSVLYGGWKIASRWRYRKGGAV